MNAHLTTKSIGCSVSAVLAVLFVVVVLASLLLVGLMTTGSWQATFLGIGWRTLVGFEISFLGVVLAGFVIALVFTTIKNLLQKLILDPSKIRARSSQPAENVLWSWPAKTLAVSSVLPPLVLVGLRVLASANLLETNLSSPRARAQPANMDSVINTAYREAEPSFSADGRTMYFNCYGRDICVSHLSGAWEEGSWTPPERLGALINTEYEEIEPLINATGDKLYFNSN